MTETRPTVLVTGVGRRVSIGTEIVRRLADDGWNVAFADVQAEAGLSSELIAAIEAAGGEGAAFEADLSDPAAPATVIDAAIDRFGPIRALVSSHAWSVDSSILDTSLASFDRHFAVNTRANWLLIKAFAERFVSSYGTGRIVALTSDHTTHNLPYGASKGALDRIVIAAAGELRHLGITANLVNPGPVDTGWMDDPIREAVLAGTALGRLGTQLDAANMVAFLLSDRGGWVNGQVLYSNGGFHLAV